ncbi:hypothetical protein L195_g030152 [Trifolium pratense]|uniref:Gag-pol polyprotein n=1 Tax=Trifolium pratense TaxID=57577 RepID=A0A2K3L6S3_TRIPR|nr:hypothetical protein L195_g030152 [Trifolium pratense]
MSQKKGESFRVYAQRWRELVAQVRSPLLEAELVDIFTNTLQGAYFERMVGSVSYSFYDLVKIGEMIENGINSGKIQATVSSQCTSKELANSFAKKKEEETNAVTFNKSQISYFPQQPLVIPRQNHQQQGRYHQMNQTGPEIARKRRNLHYDHIPMPYGQILPYLLRKGMVELKPLPPVEPAYPPTFDENARCDYHAGAPGHNIENCKGFKHKVQELINQKLLSFKEESHS